MALRDRLADVIGRADGLAPTDREVHLAMADAVLANQDDLFRGHFEQRIANDEVRRMRETGTCPTCGTEGDF